ncbi:hypothetical protein BBW65_01195 [Helicobacter enhydrae]|uniref:DUF262 domain-containing protein n=1 Tax=Helicobacter enhydrae TaxID=222136 RepID=A0A1B1U422_9HELI|nr:DUF262 domain-containing protein [Helicobacter enhydrae]ANV97510.1 hypothetical protein BBW65_01195 [Helicobacter enhydrae]
MADSNNPQTILRSIGELEDKKFFVPHYQRGYRWGVNEVKALIEDIWDFHQHKQDGDYYCLQPIVVKKDGETYRVIDGQQRLTTIFLIERFLKEEKEEKEEALFKIEYETRKDSSDFLKKIAKTPKERAGNIDFYHFVQAYDTIKDAFGGIDEVEFLDTLKKHCKVLWYEIGEDEDEINVFLRLNIGKIPLRESENIKALFLLSREDIDVKDRARFWYEKEKRARADNDFRYCVLSPISENDIERVRGKEPVLKDDIQRMEVYLKAIAYDQKSKKSKVNLFDYFYEIYNGKNNNITLDNKWEELERCVRNLEGFASNNQTNQKIDREIFHYLGFLTYLKLPLSEVYKLWEEKAELSKEQFAEVLLEEIRKLLAKKIQNFIEKKKLKLDKKLDYLDELNYYENSDEIKQILLLCNLEISNQSNKYFEFNRFVLEQWSLEHIHAQKSQSIKNKIAKEGKDEVIKWLEKEVKRYIKEIEEDNPLISDIEKYIDKINGKKEISNKDLKDDEIFNKIDEYFKNNLSLNEISNLTLLDRSSNSSLGNHIFSEKRKKIEELARGNKFIPILTQKVFDKSIEGLDYSTKDFFSKTDREAYKQYIKDLVSKYLNDTEENNEK